MKKPCFQTLLVPPETVSHLTRRKAINLRGEVLGVTRLRELGWSTPAIIGVSALIRGSYHLYQGFGPFIGNVLMGLLFAWFYTRTGRVMPLVITHSLLDIVAFVGAPLLPVLLAWLGR